MQPGLPVTILSLGYDELLLSSRTAVLRGAGYRAVAGDGIESFNDQFILALDLIIFCHTMSRYEIDHVIEQCARLNRKLKFLLIHSHLQPPRASGSNEFDSLPEPECLLETVRQLLPARQYERAIA